MLDGHNHPSWAMDVKVGISSRGIVATLIPHVDPPWQRVAKLTEQQKYDALYIHYK